MNGTCSVCFSSFCSTQFIDLATQKKQNMTKLVEEFALQTLSVFRLSRPSESWEVQPSEELTDVDEEESVYCILQISKSNAVNRKAVTHSPKSTRKEP